MKTLNNINKICKSYGGIEVGEVVDVTEVLGWMLVALLEAAVIVVDNGIKDLGEDGVRLGVGSVDTDTGIMVLQARLNNVQESGAE